MTVRFLPPAAAEFADATALYAHRSQELAVDFVAAVDEALARIAEHPDAWHPLTSTTRRCRTRRFPYGVVYQVNDEGILVLAVMHLRREPTAWRARLRGIDGSHHRGDPAG